MVKDRFQIDNSPSFEGWHNPTHRWNGWATPLFTLEVVQEIIKDFGCSLEDFTLSQKTSPLGEELYSNQDGWIWLEA